MPKCLNCGLDTDLTFVCCPGWGTTALYTKEEFQACKMLKETLLEYVDAGHVVDINGDVWVNKVGKRTFGEAVWSSVWYDIQESIK